MPGVPRRIDPDAEAARLISERNQRAAVASWPVILDEVRQVPGEPGEDNMIYVHLRVSNPRFSPAPDGLGDLLAKALAEVWPVKPS